MGYRLQYFMDMFSSNERIIPVCFIWGKFGSLSGQRVSRNSVNSIDHRCPPWAPSQSKLPKKNVYGSIPMKIPFLGGWTSILTQLFWCELQGYYWFWHTARFVACKKNAPTFWQTREMDDLVNPADDPHRHYPHPNIPILDIDAEIPDMFGSQKQFFGLIASNSP